MANKPQPTHGDLVRVNGYGNRVFQVESYYDQAWYYVDENWTDRIYELFDVGGGDWVEADAHDLTLIAPADQADEYLSANPAPIETTFTFPHWMHGLMDNQFIGGGNEMKQPEKKPTARELSGQEAERRKQARKDRAKKIDACLDWMNYHKAEGNTAKVAEIKQELAELVEAGDGR